MPAIIYLQWQPSPRCCRSDCCMLFLLFFFCLSKHFANFQRTSMDTGKRTFSVCRWVGPYVPLVVLSYPMNAQFDWNLGNWRLSLIIAWAKKKKNSNRLEPKIRRQHDIILTNNKLQNMFDVCLTHISISLFCIILRETLCLLASVQKNPYSCLNGDHNNQSSGDCN